MFVQMCQYLIHRQELKAFLVWLALLTAQVCRETPTLYISHSADFFVLVVVKWNDSHLLITNWIWWPAAKILRSLAAPKQLGLRNAIPSGSPVTYRSSGYIWNLEYGTLADSGRPRASAKTEGQRQGKERSEIKYRNPTFLFGFILPLLSSFGF